MKTHLHRIFAAFLLFLSIGLAYHAHAQNVPELIYYQFDAPVNSVANNASSPVGNNPAPLIGSNLSISTLGQFNTALYGNGTASEFIQTGWPTNLSSGDWTLSFWVDSLVSSSTLWYIFGDEGNSFRCFINGAPGQGNMRLSGTGLPSIDVINVTDSNYVFHFVRDATAGDIKVYRNGVLDKTVPVTITMGIGTGLKIGSYSTSNGLLGRVDEFRLYNRALGASEIASSWNVPLPAGVCTSPPTAGLAVSNKSVVCATAPVNLGLTGNSFGTGLTYVWQSSALSTGPWINISTASNSPSLALNPSSSYYYRAIATCGTGSDTSTSVFVAVNPAFPSGTYTINSTQITSGTNFQTFGDAITALNCGVTGPVTFNVVSGTGPYNEQVVIPDLLNSSAKSITINGNGNTLTRTITAVGTDYTTLNLNGADHITINNLNIEAAGSTYGIAVQLMNEADSNTFTNCNITASTTSTNTGCLAVNMSGSTTSPTSGGANGKNNLFNNCVITGGSRGVNFYGLSSALSNNSGNKIMGCIIKDFHSYGVHYYYQQDGLVSENSLSRPTRTAHTTTYGIYLSTGTTNTLAEKNRLFDFWATASTSTFYPIYVGGTASLGMENSIINNIVARFANHNSGTIYGCYVTGSFAKVYHNTISLDNTAATGGLTRGIFISGDNVDVRNNVISVTRGGTALKYCLYFSGTDITSNKNDLYMNAGGTSNHIGYFASNFTTLANWQTANGGIWDQQSLDVNPTFTNVPAGNLTPTNLVLNNIGQGVGVTTDILNAPRNAATPDPGAYEFAGLSCSGTPPTPSISLNSSLCVGMLYTIVSTNTLPQDGIVYQWFSSPVGVANWTPIPLANSSSYNSSTTLTTPLDYKLEVTCTVSALVATSNTLTAAPLVFPSPFRESFDNASLPADCWETSNGANNSTANANWKFTGSAGQGISTNGRSAGTYAWVDASAPTVVQDVTLTTSAISTVGLTLPYLEFDWIKNHSQEGTYADNDFRVEVSNGAAWNIVFQDSSNAPNWRTVGIPLIGYTNDTIQVRFIVNKLSSSFYDDLALDSVWIKEAPSCFPPSGLMAVGAVTSATLSWNTPAIINPAGGYEYYYHTSNTAPVASTTPSGSTPMNDTVETISPLLPTTNYYFWVRAVCSSTDKTSWVGPYSFFTPVVNDNANGALPVTLGVGCPSVLYSNGFSSQSLLEPHPSCSGGPGNSTVWFKFTAPGSGAVRISTDSTGNTLTDTRIALYSAVDSSNYNSFVSLNCDDDNGSNSNFASLLYMTGLVPNATYYVQVAPFAADTGTFCLAIDELSSDMIAPPSASCVSISNPFSDTAYRGMRSFVDASSKAIANVRINNGDASLTALSYTISSSQRTDNANQNYLNRNLFLTNSSTTNADIVLFTNSAELASLGAALPSDLNVQHQVGTVCYPNFSSNNGVSNLQTQTSSGLVNNSVWVQWNTNSFSNFYVIAGTSLLPINLLSMEAHNEGSRNRVQWESGREDDALSYSLQRSADGRNFSSIAQIPAKGVPAVYRYYDEQPVMGQNYYRLEMKSINGELSYSSTVNARMNNKNDVVQLYPNPAEDYITLAVKGNIKPNAKITLLDAQGRIVREWDMNENIMQFSIKGLASGLYLLQYKNETQAEIIKLEVR